jgi:hypothetical protein
MAHRGKDALISEEVPVMHDLIYAVAFVAMVATPAMVAAFGGRKESDPGPEVRAPRRLRSSVGGPSVPSLTVKVRPVPQTDRARAMQRMALAGHSLVLHDGPTLPVHHARGLSNR